MPSIDIPDINIPEIYIPDVPEIYSTYYLTITKPPDIDVPGCTYHHRDIKNTGNRNLLLEDPNVYIQRAMYHFLVLFLLTIHLRILSLQKKHLLIMNHHPYQKQNSQIFLHYLNLPHQIFLPALVKMTRELEIFVTIKS